MKIKATILFLTFAYITNVSARYKIFDFKNEKITINIKSKFSKNNSYSALPITVNIQNNTNVESKITLSLSENSKKNNSNTTIQITCPPGKNISQNHSLNLNLTSTKYNNYLNLDIYEKPILNRNFSKSVSLDVNSENNFLINANIDTKKIKKNSSFAKYDPKSMPEAWNAYRGFKSVFISDSDWLNNIKKIPKNALKNYSSLGGYLFITCNPNNLKNFTTIYKEIFPNKKLTEKNKFTFANNELGLIKKHGLGKIHFIPINTKDFNTLSNINNTTKYYQNNKISAKNYDLKNWKLDKKFTPIIYSPPIITFLFLIFAILVAPLNLYYFSKKNALHKIFISTPIISIIASLIIIAYIILNDGFGGEGQRQAIAFLNQKKSYTVIQEQISKTGVIFNNTFTEKNQILIKQINYSKPYRKVINHGNFSIEYSKYSGWFKSRNIQGQNIESIIPTRSRINLVNTQEKEKIKIICEFDFNANEILIYKNKKFYHAKNDIKNGKKITLNETTKKNSLRIINKKIKNFADPRKKILIDYINKNENQSIFFAFSNKKNKIIIDTLNEIKWKNNNLIVFGNIHNETK